MLLQMARIAKIYRTDYIETHALRDFSLDVPAGDFLAVMGPSGSGKTTFLSIAGLLESADSGVYRLDGEDVSALGDAALSQLRCRKIGFVFQNFNLIPHFTLFENVETPLRYRGAPRRERRALAMSALERVGLAGRAQSLPSQLSGGQRQRVAIARAIAGGPSLLLADEPTGNLDTATAGGVMDLLAQINGDGATLIMATHDPVLAARAKRQIHVLDGRVVNLDEDPVPVLVETGTDA